MIGLIHSYLIWFGDILVLYAECGLIIYLFRRWRPRTLIPVGIVFLCVLVPIVLGIRGGVRFPRKYGEEGGGRGKGRQAADAVPGVDLPRRVEAQDPPRARSERAQEEGGLREVDRRFIAAGTSGS